MNRILANDEIIEQGCYSDCGEDIAKAQDARTMSLVAPIVEKLFECLDHADFSNGVEFYGTDEGRIMAGKLIEDLRQQWLNLQTGKEIPNSECS